MAITRRMSELTFPRNLMVVVTDEAARYASLQTWVEPHNNLIKWFSMERPAGLGHPRVRKEERGILALAAGIESWLVNSGHADDGVLGPNVTYPLLDAFKSALNGEIGRLDAGTLCNWAEERLRGLGISPDGEWLPGAK
jgi:hypothetical protein